MLRTVLIGLWCASWASAQIPNTLVLQVLEVGKGFVMFCDADEFADVAEVNPATKVLKTYNGKPGGLQTAPSSTSTLDSNWVASAFVDFNKDGLSDLVAVNADQVKLFRNTGNCQFQAAGQTAYSGSATTKVLEVDVAGEVAKKIGLFEPGGSTITFFQPQGASLVGAGSIVSPSPITNAVAGDFNVDGADDVMTSTNAKVSRFPNEGTAFGAPQDVVSGTNETVWLAGDLDGDGAKDVLVRSNSGQFRALYVGNLFDNAAPSRTAVIGNGQDAALSDLVFGGLKEVAVLNGTNLDVYTQSSTAFTKATFDVTGLTGAQQLQQMGDGVLVSGTTARTVQPPCNPRLFLNGFDRTGGRKFGKTTVSNFCEYDVTPGTNSFASFVPTGTVHGSRTVVVTAPENNTGLSRTTTYRVGSILEALGQSRCTTKLAQTGVVVNSGDMVQATLQTEANCTTHSIFDNADFVALTEGNATGPTTVNGMVNNDFISASRTGKISAVDLLTLARADMEVVQPTDCGFGTFVQNLTSEAASGTTVVPLLPSDIRCSYSATPKAAPIRLLETAVQQQSKTERAVSGPVNLEVRMQRNLGKVARVGQVRVGEYAIQILQRAANARVFFDDVPGGHPFSDFVNIIADAGITSGCAAGSYCPDAPVTRGQMAVFLVRALLRTNAFPFNSTPYSTDVPASHPFFRYIQRLFEERITAGCSATEYCPDAPVTRGQMAAFLVRGGEGFTPEQTVPARRTAFFNDVGTGHPFFSYIQMLRQLAVTSGCTATDYCPDAVVTRGQMAVFLSRMFLSKPVRQ